MGRNKKANKIKKKKEHSAVVNSSVVIYESLKMEKDKVDEILNTLLQRERIASNKQRRQSGISII